MSETPTTLTHTVGFSRKAAARQYESAEASFFSQFETTSETTDAELMELALRHASLVKGVVLESLAEYKVELTVDEAGTARELLTGPALVAAVKEAFPGATAESTKTDDRPGVAPQLPPYSFETQDKEEIKLLRQWAVNRFKTHPGEFWDNRSKKMSGQYKENAPDIKHKDSGFGAWIN